MTEKIAISLPAYQWEAILRGLASSGWDGMHAVLSHELSEVRAGVVAEEPEWEYTRQAVANGWTGPAVYRDEAHARDGLMPGWRVVRRRKAGQWGPAKQEGTE
jgi:hypothetical protein